MAKPFDPNDPSTWPTDKSAIRNFDVIIEEDPVTGKRTTRVTTDPNSPEDIAAGERIVLSLAKERLHPGRIETDDPEFIARAAQEKRDLRAVLGLTDLSAKTNTDDQVQAGQKIDTSKLSPKDKVKLLSVIWPAFALQQSKGVWASRTVSDYSQKFQVFLEWIGDRPVHWVTSADYANFKTYLLSQYQSEKKKSPGLDAKSIDKFTTALNGFFKYAQITGLFPKQEDVPTLGQTIMTKRAVNDRASARIANRDFTAMELATAYGAEPYVLMNQVVHHFWPPLIALFTGARRAEVSQLLINDIYQCNTGEWVISIKDDDVIKNVKNANARRVVPIHPTLIEIGLLEYLEEVKQAKLGKALFPGINANKHGEKGNAVGSAWARYLVTQGLRKESDDEEDPQTLTFHSLRHTAISALREAGVAYDLRCQMLGHEPEGQHAFYGTAATISTLASQVMPLLNYPSIDFSKFKYRVGSLAIKKRRGIQRKSTKG